MLVFCDREDKQKTMSFFSPLSLVYMLYRIALAVLMILMLPHLFLMIFLSEESSASNIYQLHNIKPFPLFNQICISRKNFKSWFFSENHMLMWPSAFYYYYFSPTIQIGHIVLVFGLWDFGTLGWHQHSKIKKCRRLLTISKLYLDSKLVLSPYTDYYNVTNSPESI